MTGAAPRLSARLAVSASQLKDYARCERAWFLSAVARAPDDANAGGKYLTQGDLFDEAGQRHQAKMDVGVGDLVGAVRSKPGLRGAALGLSEEEWAVMAERAQRMLRAVEHHLPAPKTARVQHGYRVVVPGYEAVGGVVVTGRTDFRVPGVVWDTKSTTDRGPGRGRDAKTPPYALTDAGTPGGNVRPLADDVQASLYAWCEFQTDPLRLSVLCKWVYASKPSTGSPQGWAVEHVFLRAETLAWFDSYVRPIIDRMLELHVESEIVLAPESAAANHDGCARCFRKLSCSPFTGRQAQTEGNPNTMAFDLKAARAAQAARSSAVVGATSAPASTLETQLEESVRALAARVVPHADDRRADVRVDVNRPDAPPNPAAPAAPEVVSAVRRDLPVLDVVGVEAPAAPAGVAEPTEDAPEPRRGRGRPRKPPTATEAEPLASEPDAAIRLEKLATQAQTVADAANTLVSLCNAELRALGVRL